MTTNEPQTGEVWLPDDPAAAGGDARLVFIGRVRSAWTRAAPRPRNPTEARARGGEARLEVNPAYRPALIGLERYSHLWVLAWLHEARREPLVIRPPHADAPVGVLALRSPVRPNPIGLTAVRLLRVDRQAGTVEIDAIDFLDGTPLIDIKPYRPGIDVMADAVVG
ncbi:MAG: tRNA (N6-threonylcarbamoyladenosine(37)-N6)-methyltransferase TrmO [Hyphomicrobiaceae bacterium]|nr:tRNA (N6-threonylcarbamoyladenosine(37)-N6)-methyltransferase TrmO [Hyphomicrobiaceae bacterium]